MTRSFSLLPSTRSGEMPLVRLSCWLLVIVAALIVSSPGGSDAACGYFSAGSAIVVQPAQQAFLTWDPRENVETLTIQPRFDGNALDFGMVIPTPSRPKLDTMPRDFFKHLAVFSALKRRELPHSRLLADGQTPAIAAISPPTAKAEAKADAHAQKPTIVVLEAGAVGALNYKIIEAGSADGLFRWLKDNNYRYAGNEATLNHYVQKKWFFTVMRIDARGAPRDRSGTFTAELTPIRLQFASEKLVYPLRITQVSVKDKTDMLFYVQAPN